ncbi:MAG: YabP/YqfC family sporulation protein [Clostridiales bacterium]|nr:YabP/YqfC family sporulation protein [Clostridiales bacterium]
MKDEKIITATKFTSHSVNMTDRKKAVMTGVAKVDGATDTEIELTTALGRLIVTGTALKIAKFDDTDGNLTLQGNIDSIKYAAARTPLLKRIFK